MMGQGIDGKVMVRKKYTVALTTGANTSGTETWPEAFTRIPVTCVIPPAFIDGTIEIQTVTTTGFTWKIQSTGLGSTNIEVGVIAHEYL